MLVNHLRNLSDEPHVPGFLLKLSKEIGEDAFPLSPWINGLNQEETFITFLLIIEPWVEH